MFKSFGLFEEVDSVFEVVAHLSTTMFQLFYLLFHFHHLFFCFLDFGVCGFLAMRLSLSL
jgi:hypothetical protein